MGKREISVDDFVNLPSFLSIEYIDGIWTKSDWSELFIDDEVFEHPENPHQYNRYRLSLEEPFYRHRFEICGCNHERVKEFEQQHKNCCGGKGGGNLTYEFCPGEKRMTIKVKCICNKELIMEEDCE